MWIEKLHEAISNLTVLQINTDGITLMFKRKDYQKAIDVTTNMTKLTGLTYEFNEYSKMVIRDVNNYSAQYSIDSKIKHKGDFEIDRELHKDPSMKVIRIALEKYFFKNIPIKETIMNHSNIYDFCLRLRTNKSCQAKYTYINNNKIVVKDLSKTTRYYISNHGGSLSKRFHETERVNGVNIGFITTIFNQYVEKPMEEYDINYNFYIAECNKLIDQIESKQLTLF